MPNQRRSLTWVQGALAALAGLGACLSVAAAAGSAGGAPPPSRQVVGQLGGSIASLASLGNVLFVAVGSRIESYDVADPARPVLLGATPALPAQVTAMAVEGERLYAAVYRGGLYVFALDQGPVPAQLGFLPGVSTSVVDVPVIQDVAYLGDRATGLVLVDVADPAAPRHVATLPFFHGPGSEPLGVLGVARCGNRLAVVVDDGTEYGRHQLVLLDVLSRAAPVELGRVPFQASNANGVVWRGDQVYVGSGFGVHPFDVTTAAAPRALDRVPPPEGAQVSGLHDGGDRLYQWAGLQGRETGLVEYDLAAPDRPAFVRVHGDGPWGSLHIAGGRIYNHTTVPWPPGAAPLAVYTRDEGGQLQRRGALHMPIDVGDAADVGGMLWFAGYQALYAFDPRSPERPPTRWPAPWPTGALAASASRLFVAAWRQGLAAVDVGEPGNPRELAGIPITPPGVELRNVAAEGERGYALVWRGRGGLPTDLLVFDAARAAGPVVLGTLPIDVGWNGLAPLLPLGDRLLVGSDAGPTRRAIAIVDVSDPAAPAELHRLPMTDHVWTLARGDDGTVYAGTGSGLVAFDLTDAAPFLVERWRWRAGEEGHARAVRGILPAGDTIHALLDFGGDTFAFDLGADPLGHAGALAEVRVGADGPARTGDDLPLAASFYTSATYRLLGAGRFIAVVGAGLGLTLVGTPDHGLFLPWLAVPRAE